MNPQGKVIMQLGHKGVSGMGPTTSTCDGRGFAPNSDFYVSERLCNPRL